MHRLPIVRHRVVEVGEVRVGYREAWPQGRDVSGLPTLLLLHGFPSGSHQFRRLVDVLGTDYRVVAPDYPGFGVTGVDFPERPGRTWSFEWLTDVVEGLLLALEIHDVVAYVFDWGGPVGFRLAQRRPSWIRGLVVQNANAYAEGLTPAARDFVALRPGDPGADDAVEAMLQPAATHSQYHQGVRDPSLVAPESWLLDQAYLDLGRRTAAQTALAFDYKSNLELYPSWQEWLRTYRPPTMVVWGRNDPFFTTAGALAYLRDVPEADVHLLDTGHFALEERLDTIADLVAGFMHRLTAETGRPAELDPPGGTAA